MATNSTTPPVCFYLFLSFSCISTDQSVLFLGGSKSRAIKHAHENTRPHLDTSCNRLEVWCHINIYGFSQYSWDFKEVCRNLSCLSLSMSLSQSSHSKNAFPYYTDTVFRSIRNLGEFSSSVPFDWVA